MRRLALLILVSGLVGCPGAQRERLVVFAASSLGDAFADAEHAYELEHPGVDVVLSTAGSQVLRMQIEAGAEAHIFASANAEHMDSLEQSGLVSNVQQLATNRLVVITPHANPAEIETFEDLPNAEKIVMGTSEVPIGQYSRQFVASVGGDFQRDVSSRVVSEEMNARLVLAKVEMGEADAAVVYATDAHHREVRTVEIPAQHNPEAGYSIGIVRPSKQAESWVTFVTGGEGRRFLTARGFAQ